MPAKAVEFYARDRRAWRKWLKVNHKKEQSIWLVLHKKNSKTPSVSYAEAVEEALCFGWIDSVANKRDGDHFVLYFASRKPKSVWSKINKERIARMIKLGLMEPEGLRKIEAAKKDGSWSTLDAIDALVMPAELKKAFARSKNALKHFEAFPPSVKKQLYFWVSTAKREETRSQRIHETVSLAAKNVRANQWKSKH
jgi:uncharacterized protein YdeI (YjbR/CyaY-like superfamily)